MANGGRINYTVGFNVDQSGLNQIKSSLASIQQGTTKDFVGLKGLQDADKKLTEIKGTAAEVEAALNRSFNSNLGTLNISKFNQELKKLDVKKVYTDFAQLGPVGQNAFRNITSQILTTNLQLKQTNKWLDEMATTMANSVKWGITSSIWNNMTGAVEKAWGFAKKLDTSLNDIRIVTQKSADDMERYAVAANKAAKNLGQTTTQYTNASLIYYQQGLSDAEVQARTETTLKAANVTGQSAADVSEQLTAVWNGYKVSAEEAELYVDKLSAVAATTAADLEELSTGMSKVASAASIMGVDIDQLNAQLATVVSVTRQAPESVGTAFKTIYARMGDIEAGLDTETSLGDYTKKMNEMGFNVLDTNGKLKDMGSVIDEIGNKWTNMSREQQVALSQIMAGTRQYNNLLALFDNWNMYSKSIETSKNATGALQRQQDIYMESMEAHLQQLQTAGEGVYNALFNAEDVNPIIDSLTDVVSLFKNFVDAAGGAQGLLLLLGNTAVSVFSKQIASGLATTIANFKTAKENANQLQAEIEILSKYENANINDSRTQNLINMKRQILDYDKVITEEERNQANEIIKQTNELYKQQDALQNKKLQVQSIYEQMTGEILLFPEEQQNLDENQISNYTRKVEEEINIIKDKIKGLNSDTQEFNQAETVFKGLAKGTQEYRDELDHLLEISERYQEDTKELLDLQTVSASQREKLTQALNKYEETIQKVKAGEIDEKNLIRATRDLRSVYGEVIKENAASLNTARESLKGMKQEQENLNNSLKAGEQAWKSYLGQINLKAKAQQIVNFANMLGKVSMTFTSLGRIGDIFKDVNLSSGEKLLQIMSALSMSIPGIISLGSSIGKITGLTDAFNAKIALSSALKRKDAAATAAQNAAEQVKLISGKHLYSLSKSQLAVLETESWMRTQSLGAMTAEELQQTINNFLAQKNIDLMSTRGLLYDAEIKKRYANATALAAENGQQDLNNKLTNISLKNFGTKIKDLWGKFNGLRGGAKLAAGAIGAIAIVAAGTALTLNLVNKGFKDAEEAAKKSAESITTLTESYNSAKTAFENFQNDISDYSEAKIALEEMATGTEEWKNAVQDVNKQVVDLISNYKELAPYVQRDSQGNLSISNEGLKIAEQIEQEKLNNEYQQLMAARVYDAETQSEYQRYQTKEELETFGDFEAGFSTVTAGAIGTAIGAAIGTAGGPLGMIIGAAIGTAVGGLVVAIGENTNIQESQIEEVTDAYSQYGEELFSSRSEFRSIMEKSSNLTQSEIDALWSNKDSLIELARSVDANTQAQQTYMQQYVQSALAGNEIYESSENKEDLEKMVATTTNKNLDTFVDKWKDKVGGKTDEEIQKAYAKLMKWETTSIDNQTGNKATYYFKDGTSKTIDDAIARYALAMADASEDAAKSLQDFQFALDNINTKLTNQGLDINILSSFYNGEIGDFSNYTQKEIENLMAIKFTDDDIIGRGYDDLQDFQNKLEEAQSNYNNWLKDTISETKEFIGENNFNIFSSLMSEENNQLSLTANKNLSKAIKDAFIYGGEEGIDSLSKLINDIPRHKLEEFLNIIGNIDFSNADSFDILIKNIEDLDIEMSNKEGWNNWSNYIKEAINNNQTLESSVDRLIAKYQDAAEVLTGLSFGDIINETDYQDLIKQYEDFEKFFIKVGKKEGENQYRFIGFDNNEKEQTEKETRKDNVKEYLKLLKEDEEKRDAQEKLRRSDKKSYSSALIEAKQADYNDIIKERDYRLAKIDEWGNSYEGSKNKAEEYKQKLSDFYSRFFAVENSEDLIALQEEYEEWVNVNWNKLGYNVSNITDLDHPKLRTGAKKSSAFFKNWSETDRGNYGLLDEYYQIIQNIAEDESLKKVYSEERINEFISQLENLDPSSSVEEYSKMYNLIEQFYAGIDNYLNLATTGRDVEKENIFLTQTTSIKELNSIFSQGIGTIDTYLKQYQYLSREMAIAAGVEEEQVQLYKEKLAAIYGVTDAMAEEAASRILLSQIGLNDLADNWEDQSKKLTTLDTFSPDYVKTLDEVQTSLSQIFGVEKDLFSADFIYSHQQDITKMLQGDEEAFDRVGDAIVDKAQNKVSEILGTQAKSFNNLVDNLQEELDTLEFGDSLNKLGNNYAEQMAQMLIDSGATAADIVEIFSSMGISINEAWIRAKQIATMHAAGQFEAIIEQYGSEDQKNQIEWVELAESGVTDLWLRNSLEKPGETKDDAIKRIADEILNSVKNDANNTPVYTGSKELLDDLLNDDDKKSKGKEAEVDRYQRVNTELADIANNLNKIKNAQEHLIGKNLIKNLQEQLKLLKQQEEVQKRKLAIAKEEAAEVGAQLASTYGIQFDQNGLISNYIPIAKNLSGKALADLNELVQKYDGLINDTIPDLIENMQEVAYEKIGLKVQALTVEVELKLKVNEAKKTWAEFRNTLFSDFNLSLDGSAKEIYDNLKNYKVQMNSLINFADLDNSEGEIRIERVNQLMSERKKMEKDAINYNKAKAAGKDLSTFETTSAYTSVDENGNFVIDENQYQEDMKEAIDEVYESVEAMEEIGNNIKEAWLNIYSSAVSAFDEQISLYDTMNNLLTRSTRLAQMFSKENNRTQIVKNATQKVANLRKEIEDYAKYTKFFADQYQEAMDSGNEEAAKEAYNNYIEYLNKYYDAAEETINAIAEEAQEKFSEAFANAFNLEFSAEAMSSWGESIVSGAEAFLDPVEGAYEIDKFGRKAQKAIDSTINTKAQQKLNNLRDQELKYLREKDKLSAADVKRSELKLELLQKQIALEESQNNKNTMRLRKDAMGNYSYEFVANEEDSQEAKQEVSDARYNLWEHNMEGIQSSVTDYYSSINEFKTKMNEILGDTTTTEDEKKKSISALVTEYTPILKEILGEGTTAIKSQLIDILGSPEGLEDIASSYGLSGQGFLDRFFGGITEEELFAGDYSSDQLRDFMSQLLGIPADLQTEFDFVFSGNEDIANTLSTLAEDAVQIASDANKQVQEVAGEITTTTGETSKTVTGVTTDLNNAATALAGLSTNLTTLVGEEGKLFKTSTSLVGSFTTLSGQVKNVYDYYVSTFEDFKKKNDYFFKNTLVVAEKVYSTFDSFVESVKDLTDSNTIKGIEDLTGSIKTLVNEATKEKKNNLGLATLKTDAKFSSVKVGTHISTPDEEELFEYQGKIHAIKIIDEYDPTNGLGDERYVHIVSSDDPTKDLGWINKKDISMFDTGGYTGEWGAEGKAAILHEKELVLNKNDTENILDAVNIIRNIGDIAENINQALFNGLQKMINKFIPSSVSIGNVGIDKQEQRLDQNVHITAEFPNVTDAKEVENALNNLVNVATQYAFEKKK